MKSQDRKKMTFLWIPDASRPVKWIRLHKSLLWVVSCVTIIAISASVCYHIANDRSKNVEISRLLEQRNQEYQQYLDHMTDKNEYISHLQNELFLLSQQAEAVQMKMEELKQLEHDLQQLISTGPEAADDSLKKNVVAAAGAEMGANAAGGEGIPPEQEHWEALMTTTNEKLQHLRLDMADISSQFAELKEELLEQERRMRYTPSIWPSDSRTVTSGYGIRSDPFTRRASFHSGTDFAGDVGDPIYATADGTVSETGSDSQKGNYILLNHDYGWSTMYMHLSQMEVKKGDSVTKGQRIGQIGSTGRSTGPHLHYEVWQYGTPVNPALYLSE